MSFCFSKMSGNGNDFIIVDNRFGVFNNIINKDFIRKICTRGLSIGADGFIAIEMSDKADFKWQFYNSDGSEADMCGNGARCAARYAFINKIANKEMIFETKAGLIEGYICNNDEVKVLLTSPHSYNDSLSSICISGCNYKPFFINTGVPHAVIFTNDVENIDVNKAGSIIRHHEIFGQNGANVNFVSIMGESSIKVRTFERGVEGETLACGTGCTASAIVANKIGMVNSPVKALTSSGKILTIYIENDKIYLQGEGRIIFSGEMSEEAYNY